MGKRPYDQGVIHGRFQILHNDHLSYLLSGAALCKHLVVGITNPAPSMTRQEQSDQNRSTKDANPLTYFERYTLVRHALRESGLNEKDFSVVPFPVNFPDRYQYYIPLDAVFFLTIYDDWGRQKLSYFKSLELPVHVLRDIPYHEKGISASTIRTSMIRGDAWKHLVPHSTLKLLKQWHIVERLKENRNQ